MDPEQTQPDHTRSGGEPTQAGGEHTAIRLDRFKPGGSPPKAWVLWSIRALAVAGLGLAVFLSWLKISGQTAPGCGPGNVGCSVVLSSKWSQWFLLPVSVLASLVYAAVLGASLALGSGMKPAARRVAWKVLVACAVMITGSAVWFILIQLLEIRELCLYCMTGHAIGLGLSMLIFAGAEAGRGLGRAMAVGVIAVALLIGGQWVYTPKQMQQFSAGEMELVDLNLAAWPVLGDREAEHIVISMFDYACPHCRAMHEYLTEARERYGRQFAVVLMPLPQNAACNETVEYTEPNFAESCELAELALAVYLAQPDQIEAFDDWMFASDKPRTAEEARAEAERLVGADALEQELQSARPREMIAAAVVIHQQTLKVPPESVVDDPRPGAAHPFDRVPKLILEKTIFVSRPGSAQELFDAFENVLGIEPVDEDAD